MKMSPYISTDRAIRGLVLEFARTISPAKAGETEDLPLLAQQVLSTLTQPVMLMDRQLRLVWANRPFFEAFSVDPSALGRPIAEAWGSGTEPTEVWTFLEEVVSGRVARDVLVEHPFGRQGDRPMRFTGRVVPSDSGHQLIAVVTMQDV